MNHFIHTIQSGQISSPSYIVDIGNKIIEEADDIIDHSENNAEDKEKASHIKITIDSILDELLSLNI